MTIEKTIYDNVELYFRGAADFMQYAKRHHRGVSIYEYELEGMLKKFLEQFGEVKEDTYRDCDYCKNGTYRKSFHQWDGTFVRKANFCEECGRDLRHL